MGWVYKNRGILNLNTWRRRDNSPEEVCEAIMLDNAKKN